MTKTKTLEQLIKKGKFSYVNSNIDSTLFPPQKIGTEFELMSIDKYMSSEDIVKRIESDGYHPANIYELLSWSEWNGKDLVVALGSVAEVGGDRRVPCLYGFDSGRRLSLGYWGDDWNSGCRFLRVRNSSLGKSDTQEKTLSDSDTLTLAIETVKKAGYKLDIWYSSKNEISHSTKEA